MKLVLLIVQVISLSSLCAATEVICEKVSDTSWNHDKVSRKTCWMEKTTTIDSQGTSVSPEDPLVQAITFSSNKKVQYLPLRIDLQFQNLEIYSAHGCSIEKVSKRNFKNLKHLNYLWLNDNQLEHISSDTFEDLISAKEIQLQNNKIKALNSLAFKTVPQSTAIHLANNECINESIYASNFIEKNCKFCENSKTIDELICEVSKDLKEISETKLDQLTGDLGKLEKLFVLSDKERKIHQTELSTKISGISQNVARISVLEAKIESSELAGRKLAAKVEENSRQAYKISSLEAQLQASELSKNLLQNQISELKLVYDQLASQWNVTCTERNKELNRMLLMKMEEIDQLLNEQDRKTTDLEACNSLVNHLKVKAEDLTEN